jgi:hypothetical protein
MFYLRNLSSVEIFSDVKPWEFTEFELVPEECRTDKAARDAWINNPETVFHVYSLFEGVQANLRLHGGTNNDEASNPPIFMHGLAVDYDAKTTLEDVYAAMKIMGDIKPNWFEQTLSGNGRLIWLFEEPLRFPSRRFAINVLKEISALIPVDRLPGLDKPALITPEKYFTNGCRWTQLSKVLVPMAQLRGFVLRISEKFDWTSKELGKVAVSMDRVAEEMRKKFPRFHEWPGEFVVGAQGPTFWVDGSASPKSAIVRETGLYTFSAHAPKPFYPWADLIGAEFVERSEDEHLGKAVKDIYFDGRAYFMPAPDNSVRCMEPTTLRRQLVVNHGLSDKKPKEGVSMVEKALAFIDLHQYVAGAASCAFYPHGVFNHNGKMILNTHRIEAVKPKLTGGTWGASGDFPFVSMFLEQFFTPDRTPLERFLAWLQYFYRSCHLRDPHSGHGVIIAGPVNVGKTFLNRGIIGGLVGGCAEANAYLTQTDNFNSELFDAGLWVIDDGSMASNATMKRLFSEGVKRAIASREHRANEKFRKAVMVPWQGRIVITCNDDPVSIDQIPNLDGSILEKLMLFRAATRTIKFLGQTEMREMLKRELPAFARWLLDWQTPAHCLDGADPRFGVTPYCDTTLQRTSNLSSAVSAFSEILCKWLGEYFTDVARGAKAWVGSATDLKISMLSSPGFAEVLRGYKPDFIPRTLLQLHEKGMFKMTLAEGDNGRVFTIECEDRFLKPTAPPVPQTENSQFQK